MSQYIRAAMAACVLGGLCATLAAAVPPLKQTLTAEELKGAAGDRAGHFGDSPSDPGPIATDLDPSLSSAAVVKAMHKVADWQLARCQRYLNQQWTFGALDIGLLAASASTGDLKFHDAMVAMGEQFHWEIQAPGFTSGPPTAADLAPPDDLGGPPVPPLGRGQFPLNANAECLGQVYLDLYFQYQDPRLIAPTRQAMDDILHIDTYPTSLPGRRGGGRAGRGASTRPADDGMSAASNPNHILWWWCDSLYMAPPAWARMYKVTGDHKYLDYLDHHWWAASANLYDPAERLYFRDNTFVTKREANGAKMFWSRGNGWVMAGLARLLPYLPASEPNRAKYVAQFQEMAAKVASLQGPDGLWRAGMLDPDYYGLPENSGSAFFAYALAWGINEHVLDRDTYEPVVAKAWAGLLSHIHADGRLDCIQQTGAGPAHFAASSSYVYGVGAFLQAGREINRLAIASAMEHRRK